MSHPPMESEDVLPRLRRAFWIGAAALAATGVTFALILTFQARSVDDVLRSQAVGRLARESRSLAIDRQTAIRGYLLSGSHVSLGPDLAARPLLPRKLDSLVLLTEPDPARHARALSIRSAIRRWERAWVNPTLAAPHSPALVEKARDDLAGKELFDAVRASFTTFLTAEQRFLARQVAAQQRLRRTAIGAVIIEILLLLAVLAWLRQRVVHQASELLAQRDELEIQSEELQRQTQELEEQAVELEEQADEANRTASALAAANEELERTLGRVSSAEAAALSAATGEEDARQLLDFVLNSSPVGFGVTGPDLRFTMVNESLAQLAGIPAADHAGRSAAELLPADLAEVIEPLLVHTAESRKPAINVPLKRSGSSNQVGDRHYLGSFFPVRLSRGRTGVGMVVMDTTQFRLIEDRLLQAQKMEAVGRLAGGVAHDFNNMLTAIKSYSEMLVSDLPAGTSQRADAVEISRAADRAAGLTHKLLAFSRQQVFQPRVFDLNEALRGMEPMLSRLAGDGIRIRTRLDARLWRVTADPTEVERVIVNLVLNARDAMPDGGEIGMETSNAEIPEEGASAQTIPGSYVMLAVSDSGVGMTKEVRERLFEPFFSTKEKGKGTGLGLSTAYGIVKQSGGFISVYSEPGQGTTIRVYLPRSPEAVEPAASAPRSARRTGAETILIVEDDDEVRQVTTRILRRNGYRVLEAANGADALRVCEREAMPVDLIVTDIVMPEMGGSELAEKIRESQPDARILFTSGYTEDAALRSAFLPDGEAFIPKPFTPQSLATKARELLDSDAGRDVE